MTKLAFPSVEVIRAEMKRRRHTALPDVWLREALGEFAWSKQEEIARSVAMNRRTAVHSCHEIGKSYIAARIVAWWLSNFPVGEAFAVTSAPTFTQVRTILWREIGRAHAKANLPGRVNQIEWYLTHPDGHEEIVAFGRKPADMDPSAFQGIHARRVLLVFDEACGIPVQLWDAADSLVANEDSRFLAIGNPDDPTSEFAEVCKPGSGWNVIGVSAFDSPNFTGEAIPEHLSKLLISKVWVEEKRRKWAPRWVWVNGDGEPCAWEDGVRVVQPPDLPPNEVSALPTWFSKILGEFPTISKDGLIPQIWVRAAMERGDTMTRPLAPEAPPPTVDSKTWTAYTERRNAFLAQPHDLGMDVGGGRDKSVIVERHGTWARVLHQDQHPDTMHTCGMLLKSLRETGAKRAKVDYVGIGRGVVDRAKEIIADEWNAVVKPQVVGINVGEAAFDPEQFINLRAELYWALRERFRTNDIVLSPEDPAALEDLVAELVAIKYGFDSHGRTKIESKEEMQKRGLSSPDRADALMLAFAPVSSLFQDPSTVNAALDAGEGEHPEVEIPDKF